MTLKDALFAIAFVAGCAYLALVYDNPRPAPEKVASYRACGKQMPETCIDFKGTK